MRFKGQHSKYSHLSNNMLWRCSTKWHCLQMVTIICYLAAKLGGSFRFCKVPLCRLSVLEPRCWDETLASQQSDHVLYHHPSRFQDSFTNVNACGLWYGSGCDGHMLAAPFPITTGLLLKLGQPCKRSPSILAFDRPVTWHTTATCLLQIFDPSRCVGYLLSLPQSGSSFWLVHLVVIYRSAGGTTMFRGMSRYGSVQYLQQQGSIEAVVFQDMGHWKSKA